MAGQGTKFRNGVFQNYMEKGGKRGRTGFGVICTWNFWSFCDGEWSSTLHMFSQQQDWSELPKKKKKEATNWPDTHLVWPIQLYCFRTHAPIWHWKLILLLLGS
eukprot:TRINITY_DN15060_c0_g2_i1.p1 TRINITY_DN15060_c0_g2~~TRINITY_DN15060_c0_g2_i1.p1  ORF type:complete len:104 (+),score=10.32 TRINITY_DN15060_c0_g2_i1:1340-1651(+)